MRRLSLSAPPCLAALVLLLSGAVGPSAAAESQCAAAAITRTEIEADWLRQIRLRYRPTPAVARNVPLPYNIRPEQDAAGGCDGVINGTWGFHTNLDEKPWWSVDLQRGFSLERVVIHNSGYQEEWKRLLGFSLLLSADGKSWTEAFRHDGKPFADPKRPIVVPLKGATARYVMVQLPGREHLTLEEVEAYAVGKADNVALKKPANQSSASKWSVLDFNPWSSDPVPESAFEYPVDKIIQQGLELATDLRARGIDIGPHVATLREIGHRSENLPTDNTPATRRDLYLEAQWAVRRLALSNPLIDFEDLLFVRRAPNRLLCHCDEYLSWWSRPGGELCVLEDFAGGKKGTGTFCRNGPQGASHKMYLSPSPSHSRLKSLSKGLLPPGDVIRPDVSHDGRRVLFSHCRHYADLWKKQNKLDKATIPEDAFYHLYEMNLDGTGLRRLTRGKYDDFDGRYLPDGRIVFLSTRRGQFIQCGFESARSTVAAEDLPDSFVRCGGNAYRPVSVHTLHAMDADGRNMRAISPFESFEWNPSVTHDGRILYARWDYVDRHRMWHMGLWSTLPDGTSARAVFGNFTAGPYSLFEARSIPQSQKIIFTASAHHSHAGGSLVMLDTRKGVDGQPPMTRLTPEVAFPEIEGWSDCYFANPYPLAEQHYLVTFSPVRLWKHAFAQDGSPVPGPINSLGLYLFDSFGNLNLLYRDPDISSMCPLPIRPRQRPTVVASSVRREDAPNEDGPSEASPEEGHMLLQDVYRGDLAGFPRGSVRELRIVGVPPKTDPRMNYPNLGITQDDPGKFVLGTVPVEEDGSAYFVVPPGIPVFFQALDERGMALQSMRSLTYVQPGQTYACIGCHDHRQTAPPPSRPLAAMREPSKIRLGPPGSWPLSFAELVQPVLDRQCVECHRPGIEGEGAKTNLTASAAYQTLLDFGGQSSLRRHVQARYDARRSVPGACGATTSPLTKLLDTGHHKVDLTAADRRRLTLWMDTYAQITGSSSPEQADELRELQTRLAPLLTKIE